MVNQGTIWHFLSPQPPNGMWAERFTMRSGSGYNTLNMDIFAHFMAAREKKRNERWNIRKAVRFDSLGLSPEIMRAIEKRNVTVSTPVQAGCIPPMMDWQDVIAKAPTGTGKTFAYGIPIVEHVDPEERAFRR